MKDIINTERLPSDVKEKIRPYMEQMLKVHKDNILSIYLYGSACNKDYIKGVSDINSAIVFKIVGFGQLKESLALVGRGLRKKIAAPLFLTPEYIKSSCDTFPIEFLDMKENHILIFGEDFLNALQINPANIRYVCEEQLKGKLIRIQQAYLEVGLNRKGMEALIKESLDSLMPVFRGLLRLKGMADPITKEEVVGLVSDSFGVDKNTFIAILKDKRNDEKINGKKLEFFLSDYIRQIKKLSEISDKL